MDDIFDTIEILGIKINRINIKEAVNSIHKIIDNNQKAMIVTPNSEMIVMAQEDRELARILNNADLKIPDGAGVVLASRMLKKPVQERVAGFDLMTDLLKLAVKQNYSLYLLGGKPGIIEEACKKIKKKYNDINIAGSHHGYLDRELQQKVIKDINNIEPDILFVGMGVPLQEKFIDKVLSKLNVKIAMTVGGSFDVLAGTMKRAPVWMQKFNLEWLYRLIQEPKRLGRMMALPRFVWLVFLDYIGKVKN